MDLKSHLRYAISLYGLEAVHTTFQDICKEDYDFLKKLYDVPQGHKVLKAPTPPAPPVQESPVEEEIPRPEKLRDAKVRVVKKPASEDLANEPFTQTTNTTSTVPAPQVLTSSVVSTHTQHTESGLTDPKDIKKWQKEQEDKKKRELDAQGINPASLLTKENLQKWIVEEKKTFAAVARDHVGLPDSMVSSAAKSYGIQSETSKRRAIIAASKRK
jgi:hypothetical protein